MKKLLLFFVLIFPSLVFSQDEGSNCKSDCELTDRWFFGLMGGYQFPWGQHVIGQRTYDQGGNPALPVQRNIYGSLGKGAIFEAWGGYLFTQNVGFSLGFDYLLGQYVKTASNYSSTATTTTEGYRESWARKWRLKPAIFMKTNPLGNFNFYTKVGLVIPTGGAVWGKEFQNITDLTTGAVRREEIKTKTTGIGTTGLLGAIGGMYCIGSGFLINAEIEMLWYSVARDRTLITQYFVDGVNQVGTLPVSTKDLRYKDQIMPGNENVLGNTIDPNQPTKTLRVRTPFHSIGFKMGIMKVF